jgi:hypothetical protein
MWVMAAAIIEQRLLIFCFRGWFFHNRVVLTVNHSQIERLEKVKMSPCELS